MAASRPRVILSAAMSLDGKIAAVSGDSALSSQADLRRVHRLRAACDAIIVGRKTVLRDDPLLTVRHARGSNPLRVIVDSRALLSPSSRIARTAGSVPTIIAASSGIGAAKRARLARMHVQVISAGRGRVSPAALLAALHKRGVRSALLEGGGATSWEFVKRGLVDEARIAVAPLLLGGRKAPTLVDGAGFDRIACAARLALREIRRHENEAVLRYTRLKVI